MKAIILATDRDYIFDKDRPLALLKVCGVTLIARILNSLRVGGVKDVLIVLGFKGEQISNLLKDGDELNMRIRYIQAEDHEIPEIPQNFLNDDLLIICANTIIDAEFVDEISRIEGTVVCYSNGTFVGVCKVSKESLNIFENKEVRESLDKLVEALEKSYNIVKLDISRVRTEHIELKRKVPPICIKIEDKKSIKLVKKKLVFRTQKGLHFTSYINKPVEDHLVYYIADIPWITPNRITIFANVAAIFVAILFLMGHLKIAAILAYIVGIIDGLDGKLARTRGILTKLGYIEHSFDMLYEQLWYACFAVGLYFLGYGYLPLLLGVFILVVDSFVRHCYMQFRLTMGKALTAYTKFDRIFARIDGRRNVYVLYMIIFSWLQIPIYALYAMLFHSSLTALIYAIRAIQHMNSADKADGTKGFLKLVGKP